MLEMLRRPEDGIVRAGIVLMLMLTTILAVERRWMECEVWIFHAIPVLLLFGFCVLIWRKRRFDCTLTDVMAATWFAYYVGRAWIGNEWPCRMEFLKTAELFLLYASLRVAFHGTRMSAWVLTGSILAFGCYEAWLGASQMYGGSSSRHSLFALTGSFLNPGPYSAYLMMGVVVGLVAVTEVQDGAMLKGMPCVPLLRKMAGRMPKEVTEWGRAVTWKHLLIAAVAMMAMVLPATWSRAAFLGVAVVALLIYRDRYWKYRYWVWGAIWAAAMAFYLIKQGSADGRLIIWKSALTTWRDTPWLGVGIGGFYHAFAEGVARLSASTMDFSSANPPDGAYNILLEIVVEQGVVGGVMAGCLAVVALAGLSRNSRALFYGMVALLVFAMFSYPFDLLPYKVIAVLVVAWSESVGGKKVCEVGRVRVLLMACFLGLASWQAGGLAGDSYRIEKEGYRSFGLGGIYSIEDGYEWLASESDNHEFLFAFGKKLREEGRYNDSNAMLRQGTRCSADPMFHVLMGNNYKDMHHHDLAEQAYNRAFSVMPNRLYPLYQLMLLYQDAGDIPKAKAMARRVVGMKPKIESRATRDMKKKARELL